MITPLLQISKDLGKILLILATLGTCATKAPGQILLQLELYNNPKSIRYSPGSVISYRTRTMDDWKTEKIESLDYDNQLIVFTSGYEHLSDIVKVRRYKPWVRQLGLRIMQFSAVWFLYGGIAHFADDDFSLGWNEAGIGVGALLTGFVIYKAAAATSYDVKGGRDRLRIIDISWPDPDEVYKN